MLNRALLCVVELQGIACMCMGALPCSGFPGITFIYSGDSGR